MSETTAEAIERNVLACAKGKDWFGAVQTIQGYLARESSVAAVVDDVLERLALSAGWANGAFGAKVRIHLEAAAFRALRGEQRAAKRVMPNRDVCWVSSVCEALGHRGQAFETGEDVLAGLRASEVEGLYRAWSALDWDGTLMLDVIFARESKQRAIAKRPWPELAHLVAMTSFDRLQGGERKAGTLTSVFAHRGASLDDKILLASQLGARARGSGWMGTDGRALVAGVLGPLLAAAGRPMPAGLGARGAGQPLRS